MASTLIRLRSSKSSLSRSSLLCSSLSATKVLLQKQTYLTTNNNNNIKTLFKLCTNIHNNKLCFQIGQGSTDT